MRAPGQVPDVLETVCGWCPAPVLIRSGFKVAGPVPDDRPLSHGICLACSARMIAKMPSPGKVITGRMVADARKLLEEPPGRSPFDAEGYDTDPDGDFIR